MGRLAALPRRTGQARRQCGHSTLLAPATATLGASILATARARKRQKRLLSPAQRHKGTIGS
jgi:hypothetical protein